MPLDPHSQAAVEHLVDSDPIFRDLTRQSAYLAMKVVVNTLKNGTPQQKVMMAKSFLPVFTKAMTGDSGDKETDSLMLEIRELFGQVLGPSVDPTTPPPLTDV